ncbi:hypothetical protein GCM10011331_05010 [Flavimobilis marinus]|uniref:Integral membrane protein n=1 Tax=Flavimobilis marinus TaxID=285351 RepID=A0A1I2DC02_9MICO|nr:hypothetical protein [Flavimobilis marinus]GHG45549.1 hypothetical protein GCM10011331_05010 [Flavimobilis marinus]SFE78082.1 hypothetical protein SAMN04488035_0496 [Flavimobilis marinus]
MDIAYKIILVLHLLGWAMLLGSVLAHLRKPVVPKGALHAALTALVTGLLLVGMAEMGDGELNHVKIGIKLLVTIVVTVLVVLGVKKGDRVTKGYLGTILGLVVVNVALAVVWGTTHGV